MRHLTKEEQKVLDTALRNSVKIVHPKKKWIAVGIFRDRWFEHDEYDADRIEKLYFEYVGSEEEFKKELLLFSIQKHLSDTVWIPKFYFIGEVDEKTGPKHYKSKLGSGYYDCKEPWTADEWNLEYQQQTKEQRENHEREERKRELKELKRLIEKYKDVTNTN